MASRPKLMAMVLAGGEGKRLHPLTRDRAKPAVPFGGRYRLIDFALSNLVNARIVRIIVLTQYKSHSLDRHLATTWRLSPILGHYVAAVPAQMRRGPRWFAGSADAIFQNLNILVDEDPDQVFVPHRLIGPMIEIQDTQTRVEEVNIEPALPPEVPSTGVRTTMPQRLHGSPDGPVGKFIEAKISTNSAHGIRSTEG